ncbi:MAG: GGDEF domain-containing protein [Selenomonas sp.]|uniref:GGDEF domain-containing protein n=1 Tax=Selenomonas sp. TaxID=2053611 RepID=UPI0025D62F8A|nr:GGDEF domain-containing protein [Selenomonas sp.]MCR5438101.1 GGDEF domain-containing protein [Selenomonas sp.]
MKRLFTRIMALLFLFLSAVGQPAGSEAATIQDDWSYSGAQDGSWRSCPPVEQNGFKTCYEEVWLAVTLLPADSLKDTLFFQTSGQSVRVMVGNQTVYEQEASGDALFTSYGRRWHMVKLPELTQQEQLVVELHGNRRLSLVNLSEFSLDTARVQAGKVFLYDLPYVLSLPVALLLALIILMYYFHQTAWKQLDFSLLLLLLVMSVLSVSLSHTVQLFWDWPAFWWNLSHGAIYLLPLAGNFVIYQIVEPEFKGKILYVIGAYGMLAATVMAAELCRLPGFHGGLYLYYLMLIPCQVFALYWLMLSVRKYQNVYSRFAIVPMLSFGAAGVLDGLNQLLDIMPWKTYLVPCCVYMLTAFIICMLREQLLRERRMQEQVNNLEYEIALAMEKSEVDGLTGCRNRTAFNRFMQHRETESFSMMMLDIDHFKEVNDTLGHDAGDKVLRKFAAVVREQLDKSHEFFRWGGEEFVVYVPSANATVAFRLAEKIRQLVEKADILQEQRITVSIGLAYWHGKDDCNIDLFRRMDKALYRAKNKGRNCVMQE